MALAVVVAVVVVVAAAAAAAAAQEPVVVVAAVPAEDYRHTQRLRAPTQRRSRGPLGIAKQIS